tara:strand:- start:12768 stop:15110 length:2343 start_codon:yes stop_codon:yes gene_type:complete
MTISKNIKVIDPQLFVSSSNSIRDALGLSIESDGMDNQIKQYDSLISSSYFDGMRPMRTYAYRIIGEENQFTNDKEWLSYINGGQFSDKTYAGIFSDLTFVDHFHTQSNPYSLLETKKNNSFSTLSPNHISIEPVLNKYYDNYDSYSKTLPSVTNIPNAYSLLESLENPSLEEEVDLEELYRFEIPNERFDLQQKSNLQKNILFAASSSYEAVADKEDFLFRAPYYNKIEFNFEPTGLFLLTSQFNNFNHRLIKSLKDVFLGEDGSIPPTQAPFVLQSTFINEKGENETSQESVDLKVVDAFGILEYSLLDYNTENSNFEYFLENSANGRSQYDTNSILRYDKTYPTIKQITYLQALVNMKFVEMLDSAPLAESEKHKETIAYRIEKIGGSPSGDSFTQDTVQNIWLINSDDVERFVYADSQTLYGQTYTYNIYKYVFIIGTEYSYSDLRVSRIIGDLGFGRYCLEMFEPETGDAASPIYNTDDSINAIDNDLATGAQLNSDEKYVSDFQLNLGPSAKIVEVPILSKQVTILDAPPPAPLATPFYIKNDSQQIGFNVKLDVATNKSFPTTIGAEEAIYKEKFEMSYDLLPNEKFILHPVSLPQSIELLRIEQKPNSLADFEISNSKVQSLMIPNFYQTYRDTTIYDKIETNKKYFYLLRVLNEVGSPAFCSPVIQAELISDGGYKFAIFESFDEQELGNKEFSKSIEQFKKLINIVPNINNFVVNQDNADFGQKAEDQIGNVSFGASDQELVWDKTFKLRLTSKKTGKKIDINLTYSQDG